jgi:hypothetical protein
MHNVTLNWELSAIFKASTVFHIHDSLPDLPDQLLSGGSWVLLRDLYHFLMQLESCSDGCGLS